jgi:hypothetical protein
MMEVKGVGRRRGMQILNDLGNRRRYWCWRRMEKIKWSKK